MSSPVIPRFARLFVVAAAIALLAGGCASLDEWQRANIFQAEASARWGDGPPPAGGVAYDLALANGDHVHAWYVRAAAPDAPTVLFLHGARRNLTGSADRVEMLRRQGFHVLAIDYRGFGRSTALLPSEASAIDDVQRAFAELKAKEPDPRRRFVYGYSLGGALAIDLAARGEEFAGLIVESSFTRITDVVSESRLSWIPFIQFAVTQDFNSVDKIGAVRLPLLLVHGGADTLIPATMSEQLLKAATAVPTGLARLVRIDGATHRNASLNGGAAFAEALQRFAADAQAHAAAVTAVPARASATGLSAAGAPAL